MTESKIITVSDHIHEVMEETQGLANTYTYPVFINATNEKPDLIATSVVIQHCNHIYLVTASHVLGDIKSVGSPFYIGLEGSFLAIEGEFTRSVSEEVDNFDIAFIKLSNEFVIKKNFVSSRR